MNKKTVKETIVNNSGGISTLGLLGIVFVTLKLLGIITWSWLWVTLPFWGLIALVLGVIIIGVIFIIIGAILGKMLK